MTTKKPKRIPISAAARIAKDYGYDQVVIIARKSEPSSEPHGEHITTYGVNKAHCESAALQGKALQKFMGWLPAEPPKPPCQHNNVIRTRCKDCGHAWTEDQP